MRSILVATVLAVAVAACGSTEPTSTEPTSTEPDDISGDTAAIYAVALQQLVAEDNTFGGGGNPFTELLVLSRQDPAAGSAAPDDQLEPRPLSDAERRAVEEALTPFAPMRWIDDADEWRTDDLMPKIEGSAILGVGPITFDDRGALVPMSLWCGGLCGTWFTYRVIQSDGMWVVSDIEGPIAVS